MVESYINPLAAKAPPPQKSLITKPQVVEYRKLYGRAGKQAALGLLSIFDSIFECKLTWPPKG